MAMETVPTNLDGLCYQERDPFERAWARLSGISSTLVTVRAARTSEDGAPTQSVNDGVFHFLETAIDDVKRDVMLLRNRIDGNDAEAKPGARQ